MSTPPFDPRQLVEHRAFMQALATSLLADGHRAEDAVQECYLAALRHPPRSPESLRAWLARVVRNVSANIRRGEARREVREQEVAREEAVTSAEEIARRIGVERQVSSALLELSEAYRGALYLRFYEDLAPREIAQRLGIPVETVRSRVRRGLEALRRELDREYGGDRGSWCLALLPFARPPLAATSRFTPLAATSRFTPLAGPGLVAGALVTALWIAFLSRPQPSRANTSIDGVVATTLDRGGADSAGAKRAAATKPNGPRLALSAPTPPPEAPPRACFEGKVLDARTGEAVPRLSVHLRGSDGVDETVETAWDGRFASRARFLGGEVEVRLAQGAFEPSVLAHDPLAGEALHELSVSIGPTVDVRVDLPPGVAAEELVATLWEAAGHGPAIRGAPLPADDPALSRWRFDALPRLGYLDGGTRSKFVLGLAASEWIGFAHLRARPGIHDEVVEVELQAAGRVHGRVTDPLGAPLAGASLELRSPLGPSVRGRSDETGTYDLAPVAEGEWTIEVLAERCSPASRPVAIAPGADRCLDLVLESVETTRFGGVLESRTGRHAPHGPVRLVDAADPERRFTAGTSDSGFRFDAVPVGTYTLYPPMADGYAWDPPWLEVELPGPEVTFTCLDDEPAYALEFRVYDRATGARLEPFRALVLVDRYGLGKQEALATGFDAKPVELSFGEPAVEGIPERAALWWMVECDGYRAGLGTLNDVRGSGDRRFVEVWLSPAWRTELRVCALAPSGALSPLEGVHVLTVGGSELGTTLADGHVYLELGYDPGRLRLELDGWHVESWEGYWNGRRVLELESHLVCMVPD